MVLVSVLLIALLGLIAQSATQPTGIKCPTRPELPSCACQHPEGLIDLLPLASFDNTPRYKGIHDQKSFSYSYNPCAPFNQSEAGGPCDIISVCQTFTGGPSFSLGIANYNSEQMFYDEDKSMVYLHYTGPPDFSRETFVYLHCDQSQINPYLNTTGDSITKKRYEFHLSSCHACPGGCTCKPEEV